MDGISFEPSTDKYTQISSFTSASEDIFIIKYLKNVSKNTVSSAIAVPYTMSL